MPDAYPPGSPAIGFPFPDEWPPFGYQPSGATPIRDAQQSYNQGAEDFALGRPSRSEQALDPGEYIQGWNAAAEERPAPEEL